jgi:hypothetical protein
MTIMPMPEAAMNKDYRPVLGKNKVRLSRQAFVVKQIAEALCVQASPDDHFRLCILPPDASHHSASHITRNDVSHRRVSVHSQQTEAVVAQPSFCWVAP